MIEVFLQELDRLWTPMGGEPIPFRLIGCTALFLQTDYLRGTKDTDILELDAITEPIKSALDKPAGKESAFRQRFKMYLEVVAPVVPFFPHGLVFHPQPELSAKLKNFSIETLDVVDVIVSKLKPLRPNDLLDIQAMIERGLLDHSRLVERFQSAMHRWLMDARAADFPNIIANLNLVEREWLKVPESRFELPRWIEDS